jgi:hypothetical protein
MNVTTIITIAIVIVVFIVLFKVFKFLMRLLLFGVFLLLAFLTNPDISQHEIAAQEKAQQNGISMRGKTVVVDDYYVFSLTNIEENNDKKIIGVGAFTQVLLFRNP